MHIVRTESLARSADAERWFAALDGRAIDGNEPCTVIEVLGIHAEGGDLWVQLALRGSTANTLVVRVRSEMAPDVAHALIRDRVGDWPADGFRVVDLR